jgi:hypothetical protein
MHVATLDDGRAITRNDAGQFAIGGVAATLDGVLTLDRAGRVRWASPDMRELAYGSTVDAHLTQAPARQWIEGSASILAAIFGGLSALLWSAYLAVPGFGSIAFGIAVVFFTGPLFLISLAVRIIFSLPRGEPRAVPLRRDVPLLVVSGWVGLLGLRMVLWPFGDYGFLPQLIGFGAFFILVASTAVLALLGRLRPKASRVGGGA